MSRRVPVYLWVALLAIVSAVVPLGVASAATTVSGSRASTPTYIQCPGSVDMTLTLIGRGTSPSQPNAATGVKVLDKVDQDFSISNLAASKGNVIQTGNELAWAIDQLGAETVTLTYTATHVKKAHGGYMAVTDPAVYSDNEGHSVTIPTKSVFVNGQCTPLRQAGATLKKTAIQTYALPGDIIDYRVVVNLKSYMVNVVVQDIFSNGIDYVPGSAMLGSSMTADPTRIETLPGRNTYEFNNLGNRPAGSYTLSYKGRVDPNKQCQGQMVSNEAHLFVKGIFGDASTVTTPVVCSAPKPRVDGTIKKTASPGRIVLGAASPGAAAVGGIVEYSEAINLKAPAAEVVVEELFLGGLNYVKGSAKLNGSPIPDPVSTFTQENRLVYEFRLQNLPRGQSTLNYQGMVDPNRKSRAPKVSSEAHLYVNGFREGQSTVNTALVIRP
jgi:uncharacterized repeat protein (TIGR01451 family)